MTLITPNRVTEPAIGIICQLCECGASSGRYPLRILPTRLSPMYMRIPITQERLNYSRPIIGDRWWSSFARLHAAGWREAVVPDHAGGMNGGGTSWEKVIQLRGS